MLRTIWLELNVNVAIFYRRTAVLNTLFCFRHARRQRRQRFRLDFHNILRYRTVFDTAVRALTAWVVIEGRGSSMLRTVIG